MLSSSSISAKRKFLIATGLFGVVFFFLILGGTKAYNCSKSVGPEFSLSAKLARKILKANVLSEQEAARLREAVESTDDALKRLFWARFFSRRVTAAESYSDAHQGVTVVMENLMTLEFFHPGLVWGSDSDIAFDASNGFPAAIAYLDVQRLTEKTEVGGNTKSVFENVAAIRSLPALMETYPDLIRISFVLANSKNLEMDQLDRRVWVSLKFLAAAIAVASERSYSKRAVYLFMASLQKSQHRSAVAREKQTEAFLRMLQSFKLHLQNASASESV
jgi:hypothetical protein